MRFDFIWQLFISLRDDFLMHLQNLTEPVHCNQSAFSRNVVGSDQFQIFNYAPVVGLDIENKALNFHSVLPGCCHLTHFCHNFHFLSLKLNKKHEFGELPQHLRRTARRLRSQFQALVPVRSWLKGQHDGSDLDLDQWVRYEADRRLKDAVIDRGFYRAQINRQRDLACLLLADLSLSTDAYASDHARVIDVIRDSLYLFSEALSATGDRFALYGFSSLKRGHVRFHNLKGFDEPYDNRIRGRIAAIKPGYYTRMGAAIRHATGLMLKQQSQQRLLLLLTDGKPNDLDQYEGRYGIEDTRVALLEARKLGLRPFCVTIDREANDYLPHLFGVGGYAVIRRPEELPRELPLLYAQMTR